MLLPTDRKYADTHEWVLNQDGTILVGITDFAQDQLGDVVYVGDFKTDVHLKAGQVAGVVESVKAASDIYAPVDGVVTAFNQRLSDAPEALNDQPYETWIFKFQPDDIADIKKLLSADQYQQKSGL